ncbi:LuxR family transcriptional regulator [Heyndrickxia shackletonii]|uniref:LuxR family transcriptional regulator n=1 Tax=Heyndrickxia shackletonii TaxID=157838 RepID=A0A0Q3TKB9_9BACI|nr:response regulator transcription factor [Heyndrickxia shackletonii]KQL54009.1 LuxR family transcriptional regulator [Heyndrickxia shackletonii]MBB2478824.1 response regulator transcription factor [Bacillus sp. APMAM]NEY97700.1 response regulator transcription factor [Heyndrickxia shackletonii]RTZ57575.1 response regulator transcription factor [Bacillus sp. SAJ1]
MIKIIIVDDQPLIREGLGTLLNLRPEIEVVGMASDGLEALNVALEKRPDLILMDIRMPNMNGVEGTRVLREKLPDIKVLMLTTFNDSELIYDALQEGASGYLLKDMSTDTIVQSIMTVYHGGVVLPKDFTNQVLAEKRKTNSANDKTEEIPSLIKELTERELEVLKLLGLGLNNKEIANTLYITEGTVKNHVSNIIQKLTIRDRTQAAIFAVRYGITTFSI